MRARLLAVVLVVLAAGLFGASTTVETAPETYAVTVEQGVAHNDGALRYDYANLSAAAQYLVDQARAAEDGTYTFENESRVPPEFKFPGDSAREYTVAYPDRTYRVETRYAGPSGFGSLFFYLLRGLTLALAGGLIALAGWHGRTGESHRGSLAVASGAAVSLALLSVRAFTLAIVPAAVTAAAAVLLLLWLVAGRILDAS